MKEKVAVITGAGQGLGRRMAETLAREGASIVVSDINLQTAEDTADHLVKSFGVGSLAKPTDIRKKEDVDDLVSSAMNEFGRIDILINSAGVMQPAAVEEITPEQWDNVMAINLRGVFLTCQSVTPIMKKNKSGTILNMGSIAGKVGGIASGVHYAVSKAGVHCLTIAFARELAPFGVRVNALAPGPVDTSLLNAFNLETKRSLASNCPLGRLADADDIAQAAMFLVSDQARHITGEILDVNGGILMD
jgi:3-oxoacyl-[acyl-carrier protein] reductase